MIEALATPLGRSSAARSAAGSPAAPEEGVRVMTGAMLEGARGDGRVEELVLHGGGRSPATRSWSASEPSPRPAGCAAAGSTRRGVRTDTSGRTSCPESSPPATPSVPFDPRFGSHARTEHWDAAAWQGAAAAQRDARRVPGHAAASQLLERPVRVAHPVRRPRPARRRVVVEGDPDGATSRPSSPAAASRSRASTVERPRSIPVLRKQIEHGHWPAKDRAEVVA